MTSASSDRHQVANMSARRSETAHARRLRTRGKARGNLASPGSFSDDLKRLLELLGRGLRAETAYVLLAPSAHATGSTPLSTWSRMAWQADEKRSVESGSTVVENGETEEYALLADANGGEGASNIVVALQDARGQLIGYFGVRHRAQKRSRPEAQALRLAHEIVEDFLIRAASPAGIWKDDAHWQAVLDGSADPAAIIIDEHVAQCNYAGAQLLGGPYSDYVLGRSLQDFVSAQDWDTLVEHFSAIDQGLRVVPISCPIIRLDGHEQLVEVHASRIICNGGPALQITFQKFQDPTRYPQRLIETLTEGVWQIRLDSGVRIDVPVDAQIEEICRLGVLSECNHVMARFYDVENRSRLVGRHVAPLLYHVGTDIVKSFVESGYNLNGYDCCVRAKDGTIRCFVVNVTGSVDRSYLTHIWGSCTEVTDRVELERMSVALQEEQQERIGRDLHDSVAPLLTGLRLLSDDLVSETTLDVRMLESKAKKIATFAEEASRQLRNIYKGLVPRELEDDSLFASLENLAAMSDLLPGTIVTFRASANVEHLDRQVKLQLYRIAQEAVNNALKHAKAALIRIRVKREGDAIVLDVSDDGVGFDAQPAKRGSLGLENMKLRAHSIGATLSVCSEPGAGTSVRCALITNRPLGN